MRECGDFGVPTPDPSLCVRLSVSAWLSSATVLFVMFFSIDISDPFLSLSIRSSPEVSESSRDELSAVDTTTAVISCK